MRIILVLVLLLSPILLLAEEPKTAVRNGTVYTLKKKSVIKEKLEEKEKKDKKQNEETNSTAD